MPDDSARTVVVALGTGIGVTLAKVGAAVFTGSTALAAEAAHSLADNVDDLSLFIAQRRSGRPADDRHPLGYGREAYFWALIAALGAFVAGAAFSLRDGIEELIRPSATSSFAVAYAVLGISAVGYPGVTAIRQLLFTFLGPGRVWIVARVDIDDGLRGAQVKALVRGIESCLKYESDNVYRADVVAIGGAEAVKDAPD
jgi:Cation efflux family